MQIAQKRVKVLGQNNDYNLLAPQHAIKDGANLKT